VGIRERMASPRRRRGKCRPARGESILSLPENLSKCGKFERRPGYNICRHVFQYARDHPQGDEVYKTPNLIRAFDRIVNNEAFARCGANVEVQGSRQDFCCKHVMLLAAINDESILYLSIESTLQAQTKQGNDAIATVRGGICHKHLHNRDTTCPVCRAVAHARSEPYEFKASLQDPCKLSEQARTERVKADRRKRDLSGQRPANDVFVKCDFSLTIGNYFAFAIVALITALKNLLSFTIDTPCNTCEEASHSSDACGTCLRGFAYNLRKARVVISSIPFSTAVTCVAMHEHQASVKDDKLTNRTVRCKCPMTSPKRNEYTIRTPLSCLCKGLDEGVATKIRSILHWKVRVRLRCGTNPIPCVSHNKTCGGWACPGRRQVPSMNHLLQAEMAMTQVEQIGFGEQVGMTRQGQRHRTDMFTPGDMFIVKQEEESLEQEMETMKADEGEDRTNSTPSRGEGEEMMDADPREQEPIQEREEDDEMGGDTDDHDEFNGDIE